MAGCCPTVGCGIGRCFSRFSRRYVRRYERHGLERTQRQLVAGLGAAAIAGASLLEIGSGVGYLHQQLLEQGAATAVGIDLSEAMLAEAQALALRRGLADRTRYVHGDFHEIAGTVEAADITILDKVVCCYPDAEGLLADAASHSKVLCALTFPRAHWANRLGARLGVVALRLVGSAYRPFIHDPAMIADRLQRAGFERIFAARTAFWLTWVYRRSA